MRTQIASTLVQIRIKNLAKELMHQFNLLETGWQFYFNDNRSRLGVCKERDLSIELSIFHVDNSPFESVKNTLLHEIAHAIVGCRHMHNHVWRSKAIEIGCTGERCGVMNAPKKYTGVCPNCERHVSFNRRTDRACGVCCRRFNGGGYSSDFKFIYQTN
jgi:hypothetical protein